MVRLLYVIESGAHEGVPTIASAAHCRTMVTIMLGQTDRAKIPAALPAGMPIANKTGELTGTRDDVAVVEPVRRCAARSGDSHRRRRTHTPLRTQRSTRSPAPFTPRLWIRRSACASRRRAGWRRGPRSRRCIPPKTVYWLSRKRASARQMWNYDPALSGFEERAIASVPRWCGRALNSAFNRYPGPPVPVHGVAAPARRPSSTQIKRRPS